jgi:hypothetical protein
MKFLLYFDAAAAYFSPEDLGIDLGELTLNSGQPDTLTATIRPGVPDTPGGIYTDRAWMSLFRVLEDGTQLRVFRGFAGALQNVCTERGEIFQLTWTGPLGWLATTGYHYEPECGHPPGLSLIRDPAFPSGWWTTRIDWDWIALFCEYYHADKIKLEDKANVPKRYSPASNLGDSSTVLANLQRILSAVPDGMMYCDYAVDNAGDPAGPETPPILRLRFIAESVPSEYTFTRGTEPLATFSLAQRTDLTVDSINLRYYELGPLDVVRNYDQRPSVAVFGSPAITPGTTPNRAGSRDVTIFRDPSADLAGVYLGTGLQDALNYARSVLSEIVVTGTVTLRCTELHVSPGHTIQVGSLKAMVQSAAIDCASGDYDLRCGLNALDDPYDVIARYVQFLWKRTPGVTFVPSDLLP